MGNNLILENIPKKKSTRKFRNKFKRISKKNHCALRVDSCGIVKGLTKQANRMFGFHLNGSSVPFLHLCSLNQKYYGETTKKLLPRFVNQIYKTKNQMLYLTFRFNRCSKTDLEKEKTTKEKRCMPSHKHFLCFVDVKLYNVANKVWFEIWLKEVDLERRDHLNIKNKMDKKYKEIQRLKNLIKQYQIQMKKTPLNSHLGKRIRRTIQRKAKQKRQNLQIKGQMQVTKQRISKLKTVIRSRGKDSQSLKSQIDNHTQRYENKENQLSKQYEKKKRSTLINELKKINSKIQQKNNEKDDILKQLSSLRSNLRTSILKKKSEGNKIVSGLLKTQEFVRLEKEKMELSEYILENKELIQKIKKKLENYLESEYFQVEIAKTCNIIKKMTNKTNKLLLQKQQRSKSSKLVFNKTISQEISWALKSDDDNNDDGFSTKNKKFTKITENIYSSFYYLSPNLSKSNQRKEHTMKRSKTTPNGRIFYRTKSIKDVVSLTTLEEFDNLPIAFEFFKEFLSERMASEPLLFWLDMLDWKKYYREENSEEMFIYIHNTYIRQSAAFSLDCNEKTRKHFLKIWETEEFSITVFDELKCKIKLLLENTYLSKFRESYLNLELGKLDVSKNKSFSKKSYLEFGLFQTDKKSNILNLNIDNKKIIEKPSKISTKLIKKLIALLNEQYYDALASIYSSKITKSISYQKIINEIAALKNINLDQLSKSDPNSQITFFVNIYNLLFVHSLILHNQPLTQNYYQTFLNQNYYDIGGEHFSLNGIKNGILKLSKDHETKIQYQKFLQNYNNENIKFNPDIHFLLINPTQHTPALYCFREEKLKNDIIECKNLFYKQNIKIIEKEKKILLPYVFYENLNHFGKKSTKFKKYLKTFNAFKAINLKKYRIYFVRKTFENQIIFDK
ncbi:hypothetical protein M0812_19572 [Anaeramoeba flamelloides]|uniref:RGS domain-containing protein n=1 Tax=Anaeramoeba flamelloides TaxID=1746091 RepID=A0AAV7Z6W7_9EUKA|nr:hypothetical protein M0812_19572 [Anaeramoeba flamelloides]